MPQRKLKDQAPAIRRRAAELGVKVRLDLDPDESVKHLVARGEAKARAKVDAALELNPTSM